MNILILYFILTFLISLGIVISDRSKGYKTKNQIHILILSSLLFPIIIGMMINDVYTKLMEK
jgi:hypothetical protein